MALMFSVSGLRGVVGSDLTPKNMFVYAKLFGMYSGPGQVVIGRDTRESGQMLRDAVIKGLKTSGCEVVDLGIVPTPTVVFMVSFLKACGGLVITASHNPAEWNALKFIDKTGRFLNHAQFKQFQQMLKESDQSNSALANEKSDVVENVTAVNRHIEAILDTFNIRSARFKVGVDAVNGAGAQALPQLIESIGCQVYRLNCEFDCHFPRNPEPSPPNITQLCDLVRERKLDIGFACDPDCDRLSIVDNHGDAIGEDKSIVIATDFFLATKKTAVVTNLSTTALMDYVTNKYGVTLYRTPVGEANVVQKMIEEDALIGGEGNGGVIYPEINFTRDALVGTALIIKRLVEGDDDASSLHKDYPLLYMYKEALPARDDLITEKFNMIVESFSGEVNRDDGLRISTPEYWLHVRRSQTEPLIRIIGESHNREQIKKHIAEIKAIIQSEQF